MVEFELNYKKYVESRIEYTTKDWFILLFHKSFMFEILWMLPSSQQITGHTYLLDTA